MRSTTSGWRTCWLPRMQAVLLAFTLTFFFSACRHQQTQRSVPQAPPIAEPQTPVTAGQTPPPLTSTDEDRDDKEALRIPLNAKPLAVETGIASWYGAPYNNRRGSNGKVYNMHAMTAAHRTLPLGSVVRVTNLRTGTWAIVRITDRGPFVEGRILDLSLAAAKKVDVWRPGIATVRVEVMETPAPLDSGGRWAVQIGPFQKEGQARELKEHLARRYHTAKVLSFNSPIGDWWVRVRVEADERKRATEVAQTTETDQGKIFLVRLD
jgi:rare lipoprotein A